MWHEARKQERKIRCMLVDYRRRAERRRDFYEKIKADPTQFLQVHGRQCKIHLDPAIAAAAEGPATMMPWQGQTDNLIDRFDVRAHLDYILPVATKEDEDASSEERQINYERYRIIAQNAFLGITEEKFLKQLHLEEQFGYTEHEPKKKKPTGGAAIGFNYEDGTGSSTYTPVVQEEEASEENSDSDLDVDLSINISKIDSTQAHEMNRHGRNYGMSSNDFYSFLTNDLEEAESFKLAKEEEHEKALFSGRKSRRERRAHREKRLANRKISPPSYAAKESPTMKLDMDEKSDSRSPSPDNSGKITFITSFGDEEEPKMPANPTYADKVKYGTKLTKLRQDRDDRKVFIDAKVYDHVPGSKNERAESFKRSTRNPHGSSARGRKLRARRSYSSSSRSTSRSKSRAKRRCTKKRSRSSSSSSISSRSSSSSSACSRSRRNNRSRNNRYSSSPRGKCRRNRSRSRSSRSRSRSRSRSNSSSKSRNRRSSSSRKSASRSKSKSKSPVKNQSPKEVIPKVVEAHSSKLSPPKTLNRIEKTPAKNESKKVDNDDLKRDEARPLPRYYGRRKSDQSSSEIGDSTDEDSNESPKNTQTNNSCNVKTGNSGTTTKNSSKTSSLSLAERLKRKRQALLNKQFKADKIAEQMKTEREKQEQQTREDELRELALKLRRKQRERRHVYDSDSSDSNFSPLSNSASQSPKSKRRSLSPKKVRRSKETDKYHRTDKEDEYKRRYSRGSRDRDRDRERERDRDRERERDRVRDRERDRDRHRRSSRYEDKRNDARYYKDERRRDNHKSTGKSLVDY